MIELSKHIESLMLGHDCVIVPGLGGFVTQYVPARRVEDEDLFLPPCRSVGFNPQLTLNDGLLVQSYMQAYDTNFPETIKLIEEAVSELKNTLQNEGEYELSGIGRLTLGINGQYNFIPCEAGVVSPELYGLDAVTVSEIDAETGEVKVHGKKRRKKNKKVKVGHNERDYTISISRELVNYAAAAVVAIFFYVLWTTPLNPGAEGQQKASVLYEQLFATAESPAQTPVAQVATPQPSTATQSEETAAQPAEVSAKEAQPAEAKAETPKPVAAAPTANETTKVEENATQGYTLVLASAISEKNAENFVNTLKAEGLSEAKRFKRGKMLRVVYGNFPNEAKAREVLSKLRETHSLPDVWVMELK